MFVDTPGEWLADRMRGKRVGVYGLDYVMAVRDYRALDGAAEIVPWDLGFDHARAVKSEFELESVRESVRINTEGFWRFLEEFEVGKTEREILAPCEGYFVEQGCGRQTMDMVLTGENGAALPEFKIAGARRIGATDMVLPSLEVAGPGGHWVEVSRAICPGEPSDETQADARGLRGVLRRPRAACCATARPRTTPTAPSRRASPTAAGRSATSPATRSG